MAKSGAISSDTDLRRAPTPIAGEYVPPQAQSPAAEIYHQNKDHLPTVENDARALTMSNDQNLAETSSKMSDSFQTNLGTHLNVGRESGSLTSLLGSQPRQQMHDLQTQCIATEVDSEVPHGDVEDGGKVPTASFRMDVFFNCGDNTNRPGVAGSLNLNVRMTQIPVQHLNVDGGAMHARDLYRTEMSRPQKYIVHEVQAQAVDTDFASQNLSIEQNRETCNMDQPNHSITAVGGASRSDSGKEPDTANSPLPPPNDTSVWGISAAGMLDAPAKDNDSHHTVHSAVEGGNIDIVRGLLAAHNVDVNAKNEYGDTPLHRAVEGENIDILRELLAAHNVDVNAKDTVDSTPLHRAVEGGNIDILRELLAAHNVDVNAKDKVDSTPLHRAVEGGNIDILRELLAADNLDVNPMNKYGNTPFHRAVEGGNIDILRELLAAHNVDVNAKHMHSNTPIHRALGGGNIDILRELLAAHNVDVNSKNNYGNTPLHRVAEGGNIDILRELLAAHNVDVNAMNEYDNTPLHMAVYGGNIEILRELLAAPNVDGNARNKYGTTPLYRAVEGGNIDILRELLAAHNVDVNAKGTDDSTPLHRALEGGNIDILRELLAAHNVDVNAKNKYGRTPLHSATEGGNIDILREFLAHHSILDVNAKNEYDNTPLHRAVEGVNIDLVRVLLAAHNVDVNAKNKDGSTPLHRAVVGGNIDILRELLEHKQVRLVEENHDGQTAVQLANEKGLPDIERELMGKELVRGYVDTLYRDRQVYVDAANAILVGAAVIASVTFASWLQPPLGYTTYNGESYSTTLSRPPSPYPDYVDVEHNVGLRVFWVFNSLSFYSAMGTVVFGARSVLPRRRIFIKRIVEKLRFNLLVTSILLACSVFFVIIAFGIAGSIVLTPILKFQWYMIVPTICGGIVCLISLALLFKSILDWEDRLARIIVLRG